MDQTHVSSRRFIFTAGALFAVIAILTSCLGSGTEPQTQGGESSSASVASQASSAAPALREQDLVTSNVTFTGVVDEGGISIYQQGTHRLLLGDGRMLLLEEDQGRSIHLDLYIGKLVRVTGDVLPTVEAGGTLMRVKSIGWIRRETKSDGGTAEVSYILCGEGATCPAGMSCRFEDALGICVLPTGGRGASGGPEVSSSEPEQQDGSASSAAASSSGAPSSSAGPVEAEGEGDLPQVTVEIPSGATLDVGTGLNPERQELIQQMIDEDYDAGRWTQEYCSPHVEFCIEIHRNWWYHSFGATATILWHVEMGAAPIQDFGDGPISVDLKAGSLESIGARDGSVQVIGSNVIGYRSWSDNRHFEISALSSLHEPVAYITGNLRQWSVAEKAATEQVSEPVKE